jgi:hypothetical protein
MSSGLRLAVMAIIYSAVAVAGALLGAPKGVVFVFAGAAIVSRLAALKRGV